MISHVCFCLSVNSHHVLGAGGSHKGACQFVCLHQTVNGLLQPCWAHCPPLCICCVYHPAV